MLTKLKPFLSYPAIQLSLLMLIPFTVLMSGAVIGVSEAHVYVAVVSLCLVCGRLSKVMGTFTISQSMAAIVFSLLFVFAVFKVVVTVGSSNSQLTLQAIGIITLLMIWPFAFTSSEEGWRWRFQPFLYRAFIYVGSIIYIIVGNI